MDTSLLVWALTASVGALATVLWWLGRRGLDKLDTVAERITALQKSVADDVAAIRERLARIEGHIWPPR